jgi:hypothetical protein
MSFLAPLFFVGLAALAVPVIIHLIQKERKNVVAFPSLMFLKRVPYQSVRRHRIRHWWLLLMRLAAMALIVAAFARPFIRGTSLAASTDGARDVVILLDRSYSMGHGDQWQRAQRAAMDVVDGLEPGDRASLVTFSTSASVVVRPTNEQARLRAEIEALRPTAGATRFGPALKVAGSLLAESNLPRREVVLISDFQRAGWSGAEGLRLPDSTIVTPVMVEPGDAVNVSVTPASVQRETFQGQDRIIVTGGVLNRSPEPRDRRPRGADAHGLDRAAWRGNRHVRTRHRDQREHAGDGAHRQRRARGRQRVSLRRDAAAAGGGGAGQPQHAQLDVVPDARARDRRQSAVQRDAACGRLVVGRGVEQDPRAHPRRREPQ